MSKRGDERKMECPFDINRKRLCRFFGIGPCSRCVVCGKPPCKAKEIITGGELYPEEGEWACSEACYETHEAKILYQGALDFIAQKQTEVSGND